MFVLTARRRLPFDYAQVNTLGAPAATGPGLDRHKRRIVARAYEDQEIHQPALGSVCCFAEMTCGADATPLLPFLLCQCRQIRAGILLHTQRRSSTRVCHLSCSCLCASLTPYPLSTREVLSCRHFLVLDVKVQQRRDGCSARINGSHDHGLKPSNLSESILWMPTAEIPASTATSTQIWRKSVGIRRI